MVPIFAELAGNGWAQLFTQLGMAGGVLWMFWTYVQRQTEAREAEVIAAREERQSRDEAFIEALRAERQALREVAEGIQATIRETTKETTAELKLLRVDIAKAVGA